MSNRRLQLASLESNASRKVQIVLDFLGDEAVETQPVSTKLSSEIVQFGLWGVVVTEAYNIPLKMSEIFQVRSL